MIKPCSWNNKDTWRRDWRTLYFSQGCWGYLWFVVCGFLWKRLHTKHAKKWHDARTEVSYEGCIGTEWRHKIPIQWLLRPYMSIYGVNTTIYGVNLFVATTLREVTSSPWRQYWKFSQVLVRIFLSLHEQNGEKLDKNKQKNGRKTVTGVYRSVLDIIFVAFFIWFLHLSYIRIHRFIRFNRLRYWLT